jgi:hypothetical protein
MGPFVSIQGHLVVGFFVYDLVNTSHEIFGRNLGREPRNKQCDRLQFGLMVLRNLNIMDFHVHITYLQIEQIPLWTWQITVSPTDHLLRIYQQYRLLDAVRYGGMGE